MTIYFSKQVNYRKMISPFFTISAIFLQYCFGNADIWYIIYRSEWVVIGRAPQIFLIWQLIKYNELYFEIKTGRLLLRGMLSSTHIISFIIMRTHQTPIRLSLWLKQCWLWLKPKLAGVLLLDKFLWYICTCTIQRTTQHTHLSKAKRENITST